MFYSSPRAGCSSGCCRGEEIAAENKQTPARQHDSRRETYARAGRQYFFQANEQRQRGHPEDVHHAGDEEERHECPAASGAKRAVFQSHPERAASSFAPARENEFESSAATSEAAALQGRELENARSE